MDFLLRHPRVTKLHAAIDCSLAWTTCLLDTQAFMHLTDLSATPDFVFLLLSEPGRAPNLTTIHLFTDSSWTCSAGCWEPRYIESNLMALLQTFTVFPNYPNIDSLTLTLCEQLGGEELIWDLRQREFKEQSGTVYALPQISSLSIFAEQELQHLIPGFLISFPDLVPMIFPSLTRLSIYRCEVNDAKKTLFSQRLYEACPKLSRILYPGG
jgi:hypothetical protein